MSKKNKNTIVNRIRQAIAGIQKHFASAPTVPIDGKPTKPTDLIAVLQAAITAIDQALAAETTFHDAVTAQKAAIALAEALLVALLALVKSQLGSAPAVLGDFGFTSPTRKAPTEAVKAAAVAKRAATRAARGTKGPKAKLAIKGTVPATPGTPVKPA